MAELYANSVFGSYRINDVYFPAPETEWAEQQIGMGLNGIPINSGYRRHTWSFNELDGQLANSLYTLYQSQQDGNAPLVTLETDPYDASASIETYGTEIYTDFTILEVGNRHRGMPNYSGVTVIFEVYVS